MFHVPALPQGYKPRFDAAESVFIERALLEVEKQTYNILIPPLEGRKYVPTDNTSNPGAKATTYRQYTRVGVARLITQHGGDLPASSVYVKEFPHNFFEVGSFYEYSYMDLLAIGMALANGQPINLDQELMLSAREAIEKKLDIIAGLGTSSAAAAFAEEVEEDVGLTGMINLPSATSYTPATGAAGGVAWSTKTPDEVIADLGGIVAAQVASTFKVHVPDTILLPISQYESIGYRSMGDGRSDTILSYFLNTNKHITVVDSWQYLSGVGVGSTDRMIAYKRDPRYVRHMIAMEFTTLPPQQESMMTRVHCIARTAGVVAPYPLSVSFADGI